MIYKARFSKGIQRCDGGCAVTGVGNAGTASVTDRPRTFVITSALRAVVASGAV